MRRFVGAPSRSALPLAAALAASGGVSAAAQPSVTAPRPPADACTSPPSAARPAAFIEAVRRPGPRDTLAAMRICLVTAAAAPAASFSGAVTWDSTRARVIETNRPRFGMVLENGSAGGSLRFAGAAPSGFLHPQVLVFTLRLARPGAVPPLELRLNELHDAVRSPIAARVTGWPAADGSPRRVTDPSRPRPGRAAAAPLRAPRIASLAPPSVALDAGEPPTLEIRGEHFAAEDNVVVIGPGEIVGIASANGGTLIRLLLPALLPSRGEAPPRRLAGGTWPVAVRTGRGQSNAVPLRVQ